jgi:magnesium chelatase subunit H
MPKATSHAKESLHGAAGAPGASVRVVIITLDSHLRTLVQKASDQLAVENPGVEVVLHAATDWDTKPEALEACLTDISTGDIILVSMMFLDDHIQAVLPALTARRDQCDAMIGIMSASEIVKLTKLGPFTMDGSEKGPLAMLKRMRGTKAKTGSSGAGQMAMLRRLPKLLKFIPGPAQDLRHYFLTMQYWLSGSQENVIAMVRNLIGRYANGDRKALRGTMNAAAPIDYPEVGLFHPRAANPIFDSLDALPKLDGELKGRVGVLLLRSYILSDDAGHYAGVIEALEQRGLQAIPAFASGLDSRPAIEKYFMADGQVTVDAVVSLSGFSLVGGPAYNDAEAAEKILGTLDVPYVSAQPLEFQTLQGWGSSHMGLNPVESTIMVAIPELDGATGPVVYGGRSDGSGQACHGCSHGCTFQEEVGPPRMRACPERAATLADRVAKLVSLRRSERAKRKLALVLFNFPPNSGSVGSAAYLAVFASLFNTLTTLKAQGYDVTIPASVDALRDQLLIGNSARYGTDANVQAFIPVDDHVRREPHLGAIEAQWGPAPGRQLSDGRSIFVLGAQFGSVFVGLQPGFGYEGDPMRLLFEAGFSPTHAFSAFYRYVREDFGASAIVHFGTHGALEFMPGKQVGLTGDCWPERLIGATPNFYLYAANNPSEGALAKRRGGATLISYLTPPIVQAGLYKDLQDLRESVARWQAFEAGEAADRDSLAALIQAQAAAIDLAPLSPAWVGPCHDEIATLEARMDELNDALIPDGLHVIGQAPSADERVDLLMAMANGHADHGFSRPLIEALVQGATPLEALATFSMKPNRELVERLEALAKSNEMLATDHELEALVHALDGGYIHPAPGGDLVRTPAVLPTGRNMHGFDPFRLPSAFATHDGARQARRLLDRHMDETGAYPESIAMVLWGSDNLKSEGGTISQALNLMGTRPRFDSYGRLCGAELIPLEQLGRPRIDVVMTLSGIFRDLLSLQTRMLAEAAWLAASADEPEDMNFVRKHALAEQARSGCDLETAALRVFTNADGAYGANVNQMIDASCWSDENELAEAYQSRKCFAYGRKGPPMRQSAVLSGILKTVDLTYQGLDSVELGVTTIDHYVDTLGGITKAVKRARGIDVPVYISDQTQGEGKIRTLAEQVTLETHTRMLNPRWYEGLLSHGYEGVRQIEAQVTNTMGWSATTGQVQPWVYQKISETYVLDDAMRTRMASLNPKASARMANRLLEAHARNYWQPDSATLEALRNASDELEDNLEGIAAAAA